MEEGYYCIVRRLNQQNQQLDSGRRLQRREVANASLLVSQGSPTEGSKISCHPA
jgi:hypothetical protein